MVLIRRLIFTLIAVTLGFLAFAYFTAVSDPVVRRAQLTLRGLTPGVAPLRIVLISDIHVAGPDMPPSRLRRIVERINALQPDLVLIAGDLVSDKRYATHHYPMAQAVAPLAALRARLGVFAVLGNHDHWRNTALARVALQRARIRVLHNQAAQAGPLVIGGLADAFTARDDLAATVAQMRRLPGARILLSHSPDPFPRLPQDVGLMLAGHTHCGQIRLPFVGPLATASAHGERYACGLIEERGRRLIVGAGLGTSVLPLRIGAVPDLWLIELRPPPAAPPPR